MQYRNTKQKSMIFSAIHKHGHLTVEQIKDLLVDEKIKRIYSDDLVVYETIKEEHYHFECIKCKNVIDIDPKLVNIKIDHSIVDTTRKSLFLYGVCPSCQK